MRLDKLLVTLGKGSRSQVQKTIRQGNVSVDGICITSVDCDVDSDSQSVCLAGEKLDTRLSRHIMLNKPAGILTAARDKKQPTVMDLLPDELAAIGCMPIGRLDKDVTGLLLFTTDGEMNHRLLSPSRHVDKTYWAEVEGRLTESDVEQFAQGIHLADFDAAPAVLQILSSSESVSTALLTIHEGKFHQVKRMFDSVGHHVSSLRRESFGPISLPSNLPEGSWRELTEPELLLLRKSCSMV